jgi:hypothetical protein
LAIIAALCALALSACGAGSSGHASSGSTHATRATRTAATVTTSRGAAPSECDGLAVLCNKRLNQIVFPATHNSFAASDEPGWHFANQRYGIKRQLNDGIRALLLDVHFGIAEPGRGIVRTDFRAEGADANKVIQATPERARRVAERLAGPLGAALPQGKPSLYLCHTLCELGSEPLAQELDVIADYLKAHPHTFLMLIVEDYVPPRYVEQAFEQAGLAKLAATLKLGEPMPKLGALLSEHKQLAVFSEDHGGSPAWYMKAFEFIQDTPLGAHLPTQLSCDRARGNANSPLFLINSWIPPFPPSERLNAEIGRTLFLRRRIRRCMEARHAAGAIVAVDFYERTSVVSVSKELNSSAGG